MNKYIKTISGIFFLIVLQFSMTSCGYNGMVKNEEQVAKAWSDVENVYQRRMDLIPNLVNTVKGVANFEQQTLEKVIQARAEATKTTIDASKLTPENLARFQQSQDGLSSALSRLMVVSEQYPQLRANENFTQLMAELSGTENRIAVERRKFNEAVNNYNTGIKTFPNNITASIFNFKEKGYFKGTAGSEKAPEVKF